MLDWQTIQSPATAGTTSLSLSKTAKQNHLSRSCHLPLASSKLASSLLSWAPGTTPLLNLEIPSFELTNNSGSGKTTLLNVLAHRDATSGARVDKSLYVNGRNVPLQKFRKLSSFVEQEDALLGALTVEETLNFAAKLSLPRYLLSHCGIVTPFSLMHAQLCDKN